MLLYEKYRPRDFKEFIGQRMVIKKIQHIMQRPSWDRDAFWIQGPSGTGKTTLAKIIAEKLATEFNVTELDGSSCTIDEVRKIEENFSYYAMGGGWKVIIVNEAHAMRKQAVQAWLTCLEKLPAKRLVMFTTTENIKKDLFGSFSWPFASRCKMFNFKSNGLSHEFGLRCRQIAKAEGLGTAPLKKFEYLVMVSQNNMRRALQRVEACEFLEEILMKGKSCRKQRTKKS